MVWCGGGGAPPYGCAYLRPSTLSTRVLTRRRCLLLLYHRFIGAREPLTQFPSHFHPLCPFTPVMPIHPAPLSLPAGLFPHISHFIPPFPWQAPSPPAFRRPPRLGPSQTAPPASACAAMPLPLPPALPPPPPPPPSPTPPPAMQTAPGPPRQKLCPRSVTPQRAIKLAKEPPCPLQRQRRLPPESSQRAMHPYPAC